LLGKTAVSACISQWYWKQGRIISKGMFNKYYWNFFFHSIGSVAFGALVIPIVYFGKVAEFALRPSFSKAQVVEEVKRDTMIDKVKHWVNRTLKIVNYSVFNAMARHGGDFCESADMAEKMYHQTSR
jgi:hypothetical protein